jgi:ABC-type glycerol-3-phosphate transport system substrate-binding protein
VVGGPTTVSFAAKQLIRNLDAYVQSSKVNPADFFSIAWQLGEANGHRYSVQIEVDPNFPLVYNKALLQSFGIGKPPETISALDDVNQKLFKKNGDTITRLGIYPPWRTSGSLNALLTYFVLFGGDYVAANDPTKLAMTQPGNVAALTWIKKYADQFGGYDAIEKFAATWGKQSWIDGMANGYLALEPMVTPNYTQLVAAAKGGEFAGSFSLGVMPVADGVAPNPTWLSGWAMGMSTGTKRPDDAWNVIQWMGATSEGTATWAEISGFLPGFQKSAYYTKHADDPVLKLYLTLLQGSRHRYPTMLGWADIPGKAFDTLMLDVVQGKTDIATALQQFQTVAQAVLDKAKGSA